MGIQNVDQALLLWCIELWSHQYSWSAIALNSAGKKYILALVSYQTRVGSSTSNLPYMAWDWDICSPRKPVCWLKCIGYLQKCSDGHSIYTKNQVSSPQQVTVTHKAFISK
jgi:hypothetical protein